MTHEPPCHTLPQEKWCDRYGPGGFMGHTCHTVDDFPIDDSGIQNAGDLLVAQCHGMSVAAGWWPELGTANLHGTVPTKLCLIHSEISEAMEGHRKDAMDDKLPHRQAIEVELADAVIRIADLAGALGLDLGGAIAEKMNYNATRADHKPEARRAAGGKRY